MANDIDAKAEDARKWAAIEEISAMSSRDGDKLFDLMERHDVLNLQQITADQAVAFLAELRAAGKEARS